MKNINVDTLNTGLILVSLILAYVFPLELFVLVYAILGPLHYLTEINWIKEKHFFLEDNKLWIISSVIFAFIFSFPYILTFPYLQEILADNTIYNWMVSEGLNYINSTLFLAFLLAIILVVLKKKLHAVIAIVIALLLAVIFNSNRAYNLMFGALLPTIIHVYFFTLLFMLFGNLKGHSRVGYLNTLLVMLVPMFIYMIDISSKEYLFLDYFKETYLESKFHYLNIIIAKLLNLKKEMSFFFYEIVDLKIQMFIAFAYTYHYLNWFSKTSIIGWSDKITTKKAMVIAAIWLSCVLLFFYNYRIGFIAALFLSVLHVILEFPLNIISFKSIGKGFFGNRG